MASKKKRKHLQPPLPKKKHAQNKNYFLNLFTYQPYF